ncbi:Rrf2 family transcriptional regulator [uncultured Treponema sp.]|uniref:Rrf2 family transcriptional regulator n=1 Tax=uncultured Treponema sp. TaxID=162155 RepID=UPI0025D93C20|nr:Rrf2 family transcriptional regulator [uncultured Treponema sp.]
MKVSSKFTVAVHTLLCIHRFGGERKVTSDFIAGSTGVNPVIIRRTLLSLKAAGLVKVAAGTGGAEIIAKPSSFTLFDIYKASGSLEENVFGFHEQPNPACPVGGNIHRILDSHLADAQKAFEKSLATVKFSELVKELEVAEKQKN